jgi:hypothetical protein
MPFTISHAAAVLPFSRLLVRQRLLSAAIIGAMAPDFGVFFPWRLGRVETHSALSLLTFCLPVGLLTYWIFQTLIKTPVLELMPEGAYARWRPFASPASMRSVRQWVLAGLGIIAGAVTHLVWDGFTHEGARGVRLFPMLDEPVLEIGRHHIDAVRLLQDLGSLVGLIVVLGVMAYALRRGREPAAPHRLLSDTERLAWVLAYTVAAVSLSVVFYLRAQLGQPVAHTADIRTYSVAVAALRGLAAALVGVSLGMDLRLRVLRYRSSGPER